MLLTSNIEYKETILAGDLNCDYLRPKDHCIIKDIIKINGLKQLISEPTRVTSISRTLIDIIATSDSSKISNSIVYANSFSVHDLVGVIRKMHVKKFVSTENICA